MGPHTLRRSLYPCPGAKDIDVSEKKTKNKDGGLVREVGLGGLGGYLGSKAKSLKKPWA